MPPRRDVPAELLALIEAQDGVVSRQQLYGAGITRAMVRHRLARCVWQEPLDGAFLLQTGIPTPRQKCQLAMAATEHRGALWGPTAASQGGFKGYEDVHVHVVLPFGTRSRATAPWLCLHRSRRYSDADMTSHGGLRRLRTPIAVVQTAGLRSRPMDAVAVLASSVQQRLVRVSDLQRAVDKHWQLRHKSEIRAALDDVAGGAHSLPEREFVQLCRRAGLPKPVLQEARYYRGRKRYLDAFFSGYAVSVEIDGQWHMEYDAWVADMHRQNLIGIDGTLVLRFSASMVRFQPSEVAAVIVEALLARGWKP